MRARVVLGSIRVHGDPGERGDIALRLKENDSPVQIAPATGNLTLTRKLDKEVSHTNQPTISFLNLKLNVTIFLPPAKIDFYVRFFVAYKKKVFLKLIIFSNSKVCLF